MKRNNLLVVGLGQCGCNLADNLRSVSNRYTTLYINSSIGDIKDLQYANLDNNVFIFSGADGAGRNRHKAKELLNVDKMRLASFIKNFNQFKYMLIFTSLGGGTGSGIFNEFISMAKTIIPTLIINVVCVIPSIKENMLELKNTIECFSEMNKTSTLINDVKYVSNDNGYNYRDINSKIVKDINLAYSMTGHSSIGSIDENNLTNVTTCKGYGVILKLDNSCNNLSDAIEKAKRESVFEIPKNLKCSYGAIQISDSFNSNEIRDVIDVKSTLYMTTGKKDVICLGGCNFPMSCIEDIESTIKELEIRQENEDDVCFKFSPKFEIPSPVVNNNTPKEVNRFIDDDDIDDLFNEDNYNF